MIEHNNMKSLQFCFDHDFPIGCCNVSIVTFSLFLTRLTRMIIYGCLVQIFLRRCFFYLTKRKEMVEIETFFITARLILAFSPAWSLFVPVVKQNLAKQNNIIRND